MRERGVERSVRNRSRGLLVLVAAASCLMPVSPGNATLAGRNGLIAFATSSFSDNSEVCVTTPDGRKVSLTETTEWETDVAWSPDGRELAFSRGGGGGFDIFRVDVSSGKVTQLTTGSQYDTAPEWAPDGTRIVFSSTRDGVAGLFVMAADGSNVRRLTDQPDGYPAWSPDGFSIAFVGELRDGRYDDGGVWTIPAEGGEASYVGGGQDVDYSPAGDAFAATLAFGGSVMVYDADGSNPRPVVPTYMPTRSPAWSPNGRKIAYSLLDVRARPGARTSTGMYTVGTDGTSNERISRGDVSSLDWQTRTGRAVELPDGLLPCHKIRHERSLLFRLRRGGAFSGRLRVEDGFGGCLVEQVAIERRLGSGWEWVRWAELGHEGRFRGRLPERGVYRALARGSQPRRATGRIDNCARVATQRTL
jgi:WD40 repeat protein